MPASPSDLPLSNDPWSLSGTARASVMALLAARHADPFSVLGAHVVARDGQAVATVVRCVLPDVQAVEVIDLQGTFLARLDMLEPGFFAGPVPGLQTGSAYRLRVQAAEPPHAWRTVEDPYRFGPVLGELDLHLLGEGAHWQLWTVLGASPRIMDGVAGTAFAVWAPNAQRVSVVGGFNRWDGRAHPMRCRREVGVWELFIPGVAHGELYKFEVLDAQGALRFKSDPMARWTQVPPETASRVRHDDTFAWSDAAWMQRRHSAAHQHEPISIYEVHLGSWRFGPAGEPPTYAGLAETLIPYAVEHGFTHLELLPVSEHPFGGSWGYQPTALYAPSARWGDPDDLRRFIDRAHAAGLGVILDWVPAHFPSDEHGLAHFDGTALYEHEDPQRGRHADWGTLIYNFGRFEVTNFLIANALYWLKEFHLDGLRVDAVASMLYLDYSRPAGTWQPNVHGGNENLEAVAFVRRLNEKIGEEVPGAITLAEESTSWPGVSRPTWLGGLGFHFKWNMGWMNDTLSYMSRDPVHRPWHQHLLTFGLLYAFSEQFVLPLSHDEVVHGKRSLLSKMPGDDWQKFANLRLYFSCMWMQPGKKLLFMGGEFGQWREWNHDAALDWHLLDDPTHAHRHRGLARLVGDLNQLYRSLPALHRLDCEPAGFEWIDCEDAAHSVLAWLRYDDASHDAASSVMVVCHFTPLVRDDYRIGLPCGGQWVEVLNSDGADYGGSGVGNLGGVQAEPIAWHGRPFSARFRLPPLGVLVLRHTPTHAA